MLHPGEKLGGGGLGLGFGTEDDSAERSYTVSWLNDQEMVRLDLRMCGTIVYCKVYNDMFCPFHLLFFGYEILYFAILAVDKRPSVKLSMRPGENKEKERETK